MYVILLERIRNLGNFGDEINVRGGYARNYLIPQKKAVRATPENRVKFESERAVLRQSAQEALNAANARAGALAGLHITISAAAGEEGDLYGSVGPREIIAALAEAGHEAERREIRLPDGPLRKVGEYQFDLHLHPDVEVQITVAIVPA